MVPSSDSRGRQRDYLCHCLVQNEPAGEQTVGLEAGPARLPLGAGYSSPKVALRHLSPSPHEPCNLLSHERMHCYPQAFLESYGRAAPTLANSFNMKNSTNSSQERWAKLCVLGVSAIRMDLTCRSLPLRWLSLGLLPLGPLFGGCSDLAAFALFAFELGQVLRRILLGSLG